MARQKRAAIQAAAEASTTPPDALEPTQTLARVVKAVGNSLFSVELPDKKTTLVEMPDRFRSTLWIRRGGFVVVELRDEGSGAGGANESTPGRNVGGEIVNVVRDEKEWRKQPYWPAEFVKNVYGIDDDDDDEEEESNMGKLPPIDSDVESS